MTSSETEQLLLIGKDMLTKDVELFPKVKESLELLHPHFKLMVITKGDLLDQTSKAKRSGLYHLFEEVIVVSEKDQQTYQDILNRKQIDITDFVMFGNSMKSDIIPVLQTGARAVHVPYANTWIHEQVNINGNYPEFSEVTDFADILNLNFIKKKLEVKSF